ncbi:MAG: hypothetical protein ONB44_23395 [candidate division KSB1 bacterium]|nr:hypothetical protein [candidate division KSB1 bacterium]MDZ7305087.1 hypothetical protein [candidate division KSB1 bacterium]MDZ7313404.1 hypothetical protein [candidate division KSB1 bacterium]
MWSQHRALSRIWTFGSLVSVFGALVLTGCSRKTTPKVETQPPPAETPPPILIQPKPQGPPAGSVWDVVTPDGRLPKDLLQHMAKQGAEVKRSNIAAWKTWSVDVNGDGSKEFFISNVPGWCGSGGCSVWLWQRTPTGLRNLLPTESMLTLAVELGDAGLDGYCDILFYHRAMENPNRQSLAQERLQWDGQTYRPHSKTFLGDYLKTPLPEGAWRVMK